MSKRDKCEINVLPHLVARALQKGQSARANLVKATGRYLINFRDEDGYRLQANTEPDPDLVVEGEV